MTIRFLVVAGGGFAKSPFPMVNYLVFNKIVF